MKKITIFTLFASFLLSCGGDTTDPIIDPPTVDTEPIAVDDAATVVEEEELVLANLLSNDTLNDGARITSFDSSSAQNGSIVDNRDGSYSYIPPVAFVGEDTFTYTICDRDTNPDCSTATVTITVTDEGSPVANNDSLNGVQNALLTIDDLLENDDLTDDAVLTSIDNSSTKGTVVLNDDKTITYTPQNDYVGEDTFTYTICDDDSPNPVCTSATVTVTVLARLSFNIPSNLAMYYEDLALTSDEDINYEQLANHTKEKHTTILSYAERHNYLYVADADESNTDNVILMYSGESRYWEEYTSGTNSYSPQTFNTEHIYPQSLLSANDAVTDLHHLRSCADDINTLRSNYPFTDGSGSYALDNEKWYPGDDWRGDVARMVLYLNIRYGETFDKVGGLDLFLEWNVADPVSSFEIQRNNIIEGAQGNRNPFIDNPYLATLIWGGSPAENKW